MESIRHMKGRSIHVGFNISETDEILLQFPGSMLDPFKEVCLFGNDSIEPENALESEYKKYALQESKIEFEGISDRPKKLKGTQSIWLPRYIGMTQEKMSTFFRRRQISQKDITQISHRGRIVSFVHIKDAEKDSQPFTFKTRRYNVVLKLNVNHLVEQIVQNDLFDGQVSLVPFQDDIVLCSLFIRELKMRNESPSIKGE